MSLAPSPYSSVVAFGIASCDDSWPRLGNLSFWQQRLLLVLLFTFDPSGPCGSTAGEAQR